MAERPLPYDEAYRCTALSKRSGERCRSRAMVGGTVCRHHGGAAPQVKAAAKRRISREQLKGELHDLLEVLEAEVPDNPVDALEDALRLTHAMVAALRLMAGQVDLPSSTKASGDAWRGGQVYGPDHLGDGAPHVVLTMLGEWTDRLARISKAAIDAGLATERLRIAERQGEQLAFVLRGVAVQLLTAYRKAGVVVPTQVQEAVLGELPAMLSAQIGQLRELEAAADDGGRGVVLEPRAQPRFTTQGGEDFEW